MARSGYDFTQINFPAIVPADFDEAVAEFVCHPRRKEYALRLRDLAADSPAFKQFVAVLAREMKNVDPQIVARALAAGICAGYILADRNKQRRVEIVSEF